MPNKLNKMKRKWERKVNQIKWVIQNNNEVIYQEKKKMQISKARHWSLHISLVSMRFKKKKRLEKRTMKTASQQFYDLIWDGEIPRKNNLLNWAMKKST